MLTAFRITAILEGISYLLLFALTMPLKYWADMTEPNKVVGYAHGFLFIAYVVIKAASGRQAELNGGSLAIAAVSLLYFVAV